MEQPVAKEMNVIEIALLFRKWKWFLLFAGVIILAGTLAFVLVRTKNHFAPGLMIPKQIGVSFVDKDNLELSTRSLSKNDFEKTALFLLNQDLFRRYLKEIPGGCQANADETFDLQAMIIPKYTVDFNNAAKNETLQYLLFKADPDSGLNIDVLGNFALHIFKNYYLLEIFREYHNYLQTMNVKFLDNQRQIVDSIEKNSLKLVQLRLQEAKYPGMIRSRSNFLLQLNSDNERYLELAHQVTANEILLSDSKVGLEINQKRIARTQFLITLVNDLRQGYLENIYSDPDQAKHKMLEMQKGFADKELTQEFQKLGAFFDLIDFNFKFFRGDPMMLRDRYILLKALALCIFAFGLLLLAILVLEFWRSIHTRPLQP